MTNKINDGGPAFPTRRNYNSTSDGWSHLGMSLRDRFAVGIITGLLAGDAHPDVILETLMSSNDKLRQRARFVWLLADAMIHERNAEHG
ncbi:MAG: hypothetical protein U1E51_02855 [Candidatus Binatia bacterium]|nr:hypothetical protein [Candidatus Binatia bacterium]